MTRSKWLMMSSVLLLSMWSCTSDNDVPEDSEEVPILLASTFSGSTRAGHEDEIDPEATAALRNFWVYGYKTVAGTDIQMMNQQLVSRDDATSPWTYSPLRYWDRAASNYLFLGYVPNSNVSINNDTKVLKFSQIPQWQPYSIENDYMVASSTDSPNHYLSTTNPYGAGYVHLDFTHLLAKLTIKAYCPSNTEEGNGEMEYQIKKIDLGSYGWYRQTGGSTTATDDGGLPPVKNNNGTTYTQTGTYDPSKDFTDDSRAEGANPKISYRTTSDGHDHSVELFSVTGNAETKHVASLQENATEVCSWLVAPFQLTDMSYVLYEGQGYIKEPCFTLDVTYVSKRKQLKTGSTTEYEYVYSEDIKTVQPVKLLKTVEGVQSPIFNSFEYNKEYIITLRIERDAVEVLVDVAITPWNTESTDASPHSVYNW